MVNMVLLEYCNVLSHVSCVMGKQTLRSLSFSYQKKDWHAGPHQYFFWYDTDFKIYFLRRVQIINPFLLNMQYIIIFTKRMIGRAQQSFFWYDNDKDLQACFSVARLMCDEFLSQLIQSYIKLMLDWTPITNNLFLQFKVLLNRLNINKHNISFQI